MSPLDEYRSSLKEFVLQFYIHTEVRKFVRLKCIKSSHEAYEIIVLFNKIWEHNKQLCIQDPVECMYNLYFKDNPVKDQKLLVEE